MSERHATDRGAAPRIAIIGSGFGGIAAAIRLQAAGLNTVLYEARDKPGGRAYVYEDAGFTFDAGPTVITAPESIEEVFAAGGRRMSDYVELLPVAPYYRLVWSDGDTFDYGPDVAQMLSEIEKRRPEDVRGYLDFVAYSKKVFKKGYEDLATVPFQHFSDMLKVAPELARLRADRSVYATVSRFVQDPHVRQALSFHSLLVGGNPFDTSSIYTLIHYLERKWGVFFPRGGTGALVRAMVKLYQELGGELRLSTPVHAITVSESAGRSVHCVQSDFGSELFDKVVSNADVHHTYARLYAGHPVAARRARKLEKRDWSMSLFVLHFGLNRVYDGIAHHTVLFGPRYRELLREVFDGPKLPEDFSLYLHSPTVTDQSLAPPGCSAFYVLSPVPHLGKADIDWPAISAEYGDRILASLERLMPNLRQHVVTRRAFTPLDFRTELGAFHGSAFSVAPTLTQSAWFRPHNRDDGISGLYLVGAGTHPGAGLPGVISSAKATATLLLSDLGVEVAA
ncbi:MAG: phytoene desaturase [Pseudomonadota bacterium]